MPMGQETKYVEELGKWVLDERNGYVGAMAVWAQVIGMLTSWTFPHLVHRTMTFFGWVSVSDMV